MEALEEGGTQGAPRTVAGDDGHVGTLLLEMDRQAQLLSAYRWNVRQQPSQVAGGRATPRTKFCRASVSLFPLPLSFRSTAPCRPESI